MNKRYSNLYVKRRLVKLELDIFSIFNSGLANKIPKQKVLRQVKKQILDISVQLKLSDLEKNKLWVQAQNDYLTVSKKTFVLDKIKKYSRAEAAYDAIRAKIMDNSLVKNANNVMYEYEYRMKHDEIYGMGGLLDEPSSPFFLASSHVNPARDHAAYEGKMYYDENWESYVPEADHDAIRAYIRNHKLLSVQWVVGKPVYFTTRRNCKHYFKNVPVEEALHSSARSMLKKHGMYQKDEAPVAVNVLYYREYYNRLKALETLYNISPVPKLEQDIKETQKLLNKWKKSLNTASA